MRFSNKAVYALRALFDLGYHASGAPVQLKTMADRETIPTRFLEQILLDLKRADLVRSKRGPSGGYQLARPPEEISVRRVLEALGELPEVPELDGQGDDAIADVVCSELADRMSACLDETTLADLLVRGEDAGIRRASYEEFVYVI